jgi:membrane-associated phospholipid phosphatase
LAGRSRPYLNEGKNHFKPFSFSEDQRSFFSGHSSTTFAFSTVMANEVDNLAWKIFWYGAAGTVAGSRIYHDQHWLSDTIAGALVGYAIGNFVSRQARKRDKKIQMMQNAASNNLENEYLIQFSIPLFN